MKKFISTIYFCGAAVTIILLIIAVSQTNYILFPDAMLPMQLHELAEIWLALGFFPMFFATLLFKKFCNRKIIFLPSLICLAFLIFYAAMIFKIYWLSFYRLRE